MSRILIATLALVTTGALGCNQQKKPAAAAQGSAAPASGQTGSSAGLTGKVKELIDSGGYTYVKLGTPAGERWAAVRQAKLTVGRQITISNAMEMKNFKSKTLDREFPSIYFGTLGPAKAGRTKGGRLQKGARSPHAGMAAAHGGIEDLTSVAGRKKVQAAHRKLAQNRAKLDKPIPKAPGAEGRRVAEVHAQRASLAGKMVAVRGKVTKFNSGILGRNWIHLQDGTGNAKKGDYDLTVTTKGTAAVGDVVSVRGRVATDKDFGMGYVYGVIVEGAKVSK